MLFSCTKKVLDKLKKHKPVENAKEEVGFHNWYVDLINLERKNYFLFTHSTTLFSFFIYAGTKKELANIEELFAKKLKGQIAQQVGLNPAYTKYLFPDNVEYRFGKTNSRSVLGSMNDLKFQIQTNLDYGRNLQDHYDSINHALNQIPMGALKYKHAVECMRNELEALTK